MKFDIFRFRLAQGNLSWETGTYLAAALSGYTFDPTHQSLADISTAGAQVLATGTLTQRVVTTSGWAASAPVVLPVVPQGGPYDLVLLQVGGNTSREYVPLVFYEDALTPASNGDVSLLPTDDRWFRF